ncbi:MAG: polysaccharide biosynthesis/export family protein, partial [Limnobacter sp.]|nr:polysaccharide biosynthesis/export family protein [Limnobacter sp.]
MKTPSNLAYLFTAAVLSVSALTSTIAQAQQSNILNSALRDEILQQIRSGGGVLGGGLGGVGGITGADTPERPTISNNQDGEAAAKVEPTRKAPMAESAQPMMQQRPLSNFQRFVAEATGKVLPVFGEKALITQDLWSDVSLPVSGDYLVTPGDILVVRATGGIEIDYINSVSRDGTISLPKVGTFSVAGVKARDLEGLIRGKVSKFFKNFDLSVSLEQTGAINVFVAGQALNPGMKQVAGTNTLASAALSIAQPAPNGSFRGF